MTLAAAHLGVLRCANEVSASGSRMPSFSATSAWLNSAPLTAADLRGKVVLVDFCTYTCINWLRTLPYLRAWSEKYKDVVLVGVHTPEFDFEQDVRHVRRALQEMRIEYPVVIDNDYGIWRSFNNQYWPALYFVDAKGRIRDHQFGEGEYERCENVIQKLIVEAGGDGAARGLVSVQGRGIEAEGDWGSLQSLENYLGYGRTENFASAGGVLDKPRNYSAPANLRLNHWALTGNWTITAHAAVLNQAGGTLEYRFHARDLHAVMFPARGPVRVEVRLDGEAPRGAHGGDVDEYGNGVLTHPRLYQLIRQPRPVIDRTCEITFLDPGVEIFSFTFG